MASRVEDIIQQTGNIPNVLRNSGIGMLVYPVEAPEFTNRRSEQAAWRNPAEAADYLIGQGRRHSLLHGAIQISKAVRTRLEGFTTRVQQRDPQVKIDALLSDDDIDGQRDAVRACFNAHGGANLPSAVFSLGEPATLPVLSELRRRRLDIPSDIAMPVILFVGAAVVMHSVLAYTRCSRHTPAIGDNKNAARTAGINVERHRLSLYTLSGALTGLAGLLFATRVNAGDPIVVLCHGRTAANLTAAATSMAEVVSAIVGRADMAEAAAHEATG